MAFESENVPKNKKYMISTRGNSAYKWQTDPSIIGALEVPSEPRLNLHDEYTAWGVEGKQDVFEEALHVWMERNLRDDFIRACENVPIETCCCGLLSDDDSTMKVLVPAVNNGWIKATNIKLAQSGHTFAIDTFIWTWHNATGKSETNILLVRFFQLPTSVSAN